MDDMRLRLEITRRGRRRLESEFVNPFQVGHRFRRGIDRHAPATWRSKAPQIVKPHDVIGMGVCHDDGVDFPNIFAQTLGAKICPGIDHVGTFRRLQIDRSASAVVARIGRAANPAVTTNHRHALRSTGAEESQGKLRVES